MLRVLAYVRFFVLVRYYRAYRVSSYEFSRRAGFFAIGPVSFYVYAGVSSYYLSVARLRQVYSLIKYPMLCTNGGGPFLHRYTRVYRVHYFIRTLPYTATGPCGA